MRRYHESFPPRRNERGTWSWAYRSTSGSWTGGACWTEGDAAAALAKAEASDTGRSRAAE